MIEHIEQSNPKKMPPYNCDICDFSCAVMRDYIRHTSTAKHMKRLNIQQGHPKEKTDNFYCESCDVTCKYIRDYNRHLSTARHIGRTAIPHDPTEKTPMPIFQCVSISEATFMKCFQMMMDRQSE